MAEVSVRRFSLTVLIVTFTAAFAILCFMPETWFSYLAAIFLVAKGKFKTFLVASKEKLWLYIKTMTLFKAITVGVKRFFIDNYLSKWLERHIVSPLKPSLSAWGRYYLSLNPKERAKKALFFIIPASVLVWAAQAANILEHLFFYAEIKAVVIGFFKMVWFLSGKIWALVYALFFQSWIAPLLQVLALSYILEKIERLPYVGPAVRSFFEKVEAGLDRLFSRVAAMWRQYVERHISLQTRRWLKRLIRVLDDKLEALKHRNEIFLMDRFIQTWVQEGKVREYFEGALQKWQEQHGPPDTAKKKTAFLSDLNRTTADNVEVAAFFDLAPYPPVRDVLVIESLATDRHHGNRLRGLRSGGYWVLNLSDDVVTIHTQRGEREVKPGKIRLFREGEGMPVLQGGIVPIEVG